jgi:hypothetical protein
MKTALLPAADAPPFTMTGAADDDDATRYVELTSACAVKDAIYRYCPPDHPDRRPVLRMTALPEVRAARPSPARWAFPWRLAGALGA